MPPERVRRLLDILVSAGGLAVLSPLFFCLGVWIRLDSPGPVFYRATRVGRDGGMFRLYKFRTMVADADRRGPGITASGDKRVTRVGRLLRRTKLDELPQLINVFKGDMGLVGPRPEDTRYVAIYTAKQRKVLSVRPGMTSVASLAYRQEEASLTGPDWEKVYRERVLPDKLAIELEYLKHRTVGTDVKLVLRTVAAIFR